MFNPWMLYHKQRSKPVQNFLALQHEKPPMFNYLKNHHTEKVSWIWMWPSFSQQTVFKALRTTINKYIGLREWQLLHRRRKSCKAFGKVSVLSDFNLLKPTGYVMHNNCKLCFYYEYTSMYLSENRDLCHTINWLDFITEMKIVYSAVRTGPLNKAVCASLLKVNLTCNASKNFMKFSYLLAVSNRIFEDGRHCSTHRRG
jgi:hypothetical protein